MLVAHARVLHVALMLLLGGACQQAVDPTVPRVLDATTAAQPLPSDTTTQPSDASTAEQPVAARTILVGHVENARDLGGIPLASGARVAARSLLRGPPLANLTPEGCVEVSELGLRSVIDLRVSTESSILADAPCALESAQLVAAPLPVPYNVSAQDYIADLDANESIAQVFQVLGDEARYPVYFHCTWGRDRTGILAAVILLALGATHEAIMQDYLVSNASVGAYPASLQAALEEVERRGGIDAYLNAAGVKEAELQVLRSRAVENAR